MLFKKNINYTVTHEAPEPVDEPQEDDDTGFTPESVVVEVLEFTDEFNLAQTIAKVRDTVKIFRSATKKDMYLDPKVLQTIGKTLAVQLDCKTRWDSTVTMLERFLRLTEGNCIQHALIDAKSNIVFSEEEISILKNVTTSLKLVQITTKTICKRNSTLLDADSAMAYLIRHLNSNDAFVQALKLAITTRYKERRSTECEVLQFFHLGDRSNNDFSVATSDDVAKFVRGMYKDDAIDVNNNGDVVIVNEEEEESEIVILDDFEARLVGEIQNKRMCSVNVTNKDSLESRILEEVTLFQKSGVKGPILQYCTKNLLNINCTSVEAERNFSASGRICNRFNARLLDTTLNNLSMLKSHFLGEES